MQGRALTNGQSSHRQARRSLPCSRHGASGNRFTRLNEPGSMDVLMNDGVLIAVVLAGDHHGEFFVNLEKNDRHHECASQIEGMALSECEIVRHRRLPSCGGDHPRSTGADVFGGGCGHLARRSRRGRTLA